MKDPYVHAEKTPAPGFGHAAMRAIITEATGLVPDLPKTVGTGCGVRRLLASTSTRPEAITCLPCREWARDQYLQWARFSAATVDLATEPGWRGPSADELLDEERTYRELAARFEVSR
jgi:hypothetical protein